MPGSTTSQPWPEFLVRPRPNRRLRSTLLLSHHSAWTLPARSEMGNCSPHQVTTIAISPIASADARSVRRHLVRIVTANADTTPTITTAVHTGNHHDERTSRVNGGVGPPKSG